MGNDVNYSSIGIILPSFNLKIKVKTFITNKFRNSCLKTKNSTKF